MLSSSKAFPMASGLCAGDGSRSNWLIVLGKPIVQLLFQRGAFDSQATILTNQALVFYALGIVPSAFHLVIAKAYWALQDTWTPLKVSVVSVLANIVFNLLLIGPLAHGGLALATSISHFLWVLITVVLLRRKVGALGGSRILSSFIRITLWHSHGACAWVYKFYSPRLFLSVEERFLWYNSLWTWPANFRRRRGENPYHTFAQEISGKIGGRQDGKTYEFGRCSFPYQGRDREKS